MSTKCQVCGKTPGNGNRVSHANNKTKRRWMPNLQTVRIRQASGNRKKNTCLYPVYPFRKDNRYLSHKFYIQPVFMQNTGSLLAS